MGICTSTFLADSEYSAVYQRSFFSGRGWVVWLVVSRLVFFDSIPSYNRLLGRQVVLNVSIALPTSTNLAGWDIELAVNCNLSSIDHMLWFTLSKKTSGEKSAVRTYYIHCQENNFKSVLSAASVRVHNVILNIPINTFVGIRWAQNNHGQCVPV